jgi:hypothetical protein
VTGRLCRFSRGFAYEVGRALSNGVHEVHQWRETSWTDIMLYRLRRLHVKRLRVKASNESATAADMDWWFVQTQPSQTIRLTVQSKILHYRHSRSTWGYPDLRHPRVNHAGQSQKLRSYAASERSAGFPTYPLYLFFNPDRAFTAPTHDLSGTFSGVTVADAEVIGAYLDSKCVRGKIPRPQVRLGALAGMMRDLHHLLCAGGEASVPTPDDVATFLRAQRAAAGEVADIPALRNLPKIEVAESIPEKVLAIMRGKDEVSGDSDDEGEEIHPERDQVVFVSGPLPEWFRTRLR